MGDGQVKMARAIVSLGSNLEPRAEYLECAREALAAFPGTSILKASSVIETEPVDVPHEFSALRFLNQVLELETSLGVWDFSRRMHSVEDALGRVRTVRNGPRTIDIDLIDFDGMVIDEPELTLPHPRAHLRDFVMRPLAELKLEIAALGRRGVMGLVLCAAAFGVGGAFAALPAFDRESACAFIEKVTGKLSAAEEREWWNIGGSQHGIFAKRYHLAFLGYAAERLAGRERAGRILGSILRRYLKNDIWCYSQSKSYWGQKPWAPDPCFRENVMYTGHLLQLLALYEKCTGDVRYHRKGGGWDFVWKDGRRVHYDVEKLIEVTVEQMRGGPNGGITCEPGLMFFACNNHPHIALGIFRELGYGDWTEDARRWEKWALGHYLDPMFGGGLFKLVYHVKSGMMLPRGDGGFDGWSLAFYAPWASDGNRCRELWRTARARIDWRAMQDPADSAAKHSVGQCFGQDAVPRSVAAVFLAAAAAACDDWETARRLLEPVEARYLARHGGMLYLNLNREWRLGATAMYFMGAAVGH